MQVEQIVVELKPVAHEEQSIPVKPIAQVAHIELLLHTLQFELITVQLLQVPLAY